MELSSALDMLDDYCRFDDDVARKKKLIDGRLCCVSFSFLDMIRLEAGARVLPRMKVGSRWLTAIPPDLAYGPGGRYPVIGPNETILVEVELVEIKD